jgi:hypothetical protein
VVAAAALWLSLAAAGDPCTAAAKPDPKRALVLDHARLLDADGER